MDSQLLGLGIQKALGMLPDIQVAFLKEDKVVAKESSEHQLVPDCIFKLAFLNSYFKIFIYILFDINVVNLLI